MMATTSFCKTCCALERGNSSRVTTFSSTPPKFNFAIVVDLCCFNLKAVNNYLLIVKHLFHSNYLHIKDLFLLVQVLIGHQFLRRIHCLKFLQFLMKAVTVFYDGNPGASYKFYQAKGFQYFQ